LKPLHSTLLGYPFFNGNEPLLDVKSLYSRSKIGQQFRHTAPPSMSSSPLAIAEETATCASIREVVPATAGRLTVMRLSRQLAGKRAAIERDHRAALTAAIQLRFARTGFHGELKA